MLYISTFSQYEKHDNMIISWHGNILLIAEILKFIGSLAKRVLTSLVK